jgi:hypothetical protein
MVIGEFDVKKRGNALFSRLPDDWGKVEKFFDGG